MSDPSSSSPSSSSSSLDDIPGETLYELLSTFGDVELKVLSLTSKSLYITASQIIYERDAKKTKGYALRWASAAGVLVNTAWLSTLVGADVNAGTTKAEVDMLRLKEQFTPSVMTLDPAEARVQIFHEYVRQLEELKPYYKVGQTPLHLAIAAGNVTMVAMLLIVPGIDINRKDAFGQTPLHFAAAYGNLNIVKLLYRNPGLDHNAVERRNRTALHYAIYQGRYDIVKFMLDQGRMNNDMPDAYSLTPYLLCATFGDVRVHELLRNCPSITVPEDFTFRPLDNRPVDPTDDEVFWEVMYANFQTDYPMKMLPYIDGPYGTPIHREISEGGENLVDLLASRAYNVNLKGGRKQNTPLHHAVLEGSHNCVHILLSRMEIDMNCINVDGATPLMLATRLNMPDIVRVLLSRSGVDVDIMDRNGETPFLHAAEMGYTEITDNIIRYCREAKSLTI